MRSIALMVLVSGCFYVDPINQRPSIDIVQRTPGTVHRGDMLMLDANVNDPEGQYVALTWHAQACGNADDPTSCDKPFYSHLDQTAAIAVPLVLDSGAPVNALIVKLEAIDDHGATAKPDQTLVVTVEDRPPDVTLAKSSKYGYVIGTPVDLFAKVGDRDDGADKVAVAWQVFSPASQPAFTLTDLQPAQDPADPAHRVYGQRLVPQGLGDWDIQLTAKDPAEQLPGSVDPGVTQHVTVTVMPDHAPCLAQWSPIAAPPGQALPIYDPTLFQVLVVQDDLDPYPAVSDPLLGQTTFHWSLLAPGATTRQPLATSDAAAAIDPGAYAPGDVVELRVEIEDRNHTPLPCADDMATCSINADPTCSQRLTWRVVVQ